MPLPDPDYTEDFDLLHRDQLQRVVTVGPTAGTLPGAAPADLIHWATMELGEKQMFHQQLEEYADIIGETTEADYITSLEAFGAVAGFQMFDYQGAIVGGNPTGLDTLTTYTANFLVDGVTTVNVSIDGSAATTFTDLLTELNTDLGADATASYVGGDLYIQSDGATGGGTTAVVWLGGSLFPATNFFLIEREPRPETADFADWVATLGPTGADQFDVFWDENLVTHEGYPPFRRPVAGTKSTEAYHDPFTDEWKRLIDDVVIV